METATAGHALMDVTTDTFEQEVTNFPGVVLVDFWATWCGPCRILTPRVEEIAEKYKDNAQVKIVAIDTDQESELSERFKIRSIPSLKVFIKGEVVNQSIGVVPTERIEDLVKDGLSRLTV